MALASPSGPLRIATFESLEVTPLSADDAAAYARLASDEVVLAIGTATIGVRFSRGSAAAAFAERFGDMLAHRAGDIIVYAVALEREAYFFLSPGDARRWAEPASDELLVFFADNVAMYHHFSISDDLGFHAAVVASASRVVVLTGASTAGKTTTAIAAVRNGFSFYSDERCIVQHDTIVPFPRALTIREGGRSALLGDGAAPSALTERLREMPPNGENAIRPSMLFGEPLGGLAVALAGVFIIEGRADVPLVEPSSVYATLHALLRSTSCRETGLARVARLVAQLRSVPVYRLWLGSPDASARAIERTLDAADAGPSS